MCFRGVTLMTITKDENGAKLMLSLEGRLDTTTAKQLEDEIEACLDGKTEVVLDFKSLDYLSSAGLRVILGTQKKMNKQGTLVIRNVNETIMEVFELTGFADILTIEQF